ncbi:hypothetical protein AB4Y45_32710 [Paraburkholderia sp. EG287A]|uniref:hypothetical protein n=1 Tax=Paraburkholderia sp. EG287A TaxID=3237012 RepID=UPI0034D34217
MEKAFLTVVVANANVKDVVEHLRDLDRNVKVEVLADGDIRISETDIAMLPNEVWLHDVERNGVLALVKDSECTEGRMLTDGELRALQDYGVCVEFKADHSSAAKYGSPVYTIYDAAAMAEAANYGFAVAKEGEFVTSFNDTGDDSAEQRWLRVRVPAWMNFAVTL